MWQEDQHLAFLISEIYRIFCCPSNFISAAARLLAVELPYIVTVISNFFAFTSKCSIKKNIMQYSTIQILGTAVAQWLRRCATNRKVAG